jgi:hypothetical protein
MEILIKFHFISTQLPIQWVPGTLSLEIKWPRHEVDCPSPFSAEVKSV